MEESSVSNVNVVDGNQSELSQRIVITDVKDPKLPTIPGYVIRDVVIRVHDIGFILGNKTTIRLTKSVLQKLAYIDGKGNKTTSTIPTVQETAVEILNPSVPVVEPLGILMEETVSEPGPKRSRTGRVIKPKKIISPDELKKSKTKKSDTKNSLKPKQVAIGNIDTDKSKTSIEMPVSQASSTVTKIRRNPLRDDSVDPLSMNIDTSSGSVTNPGKKKRIPPPRGTKHFFEDDLPRTAGLRRKSGCAESSVQPENLPHSLKKNSSRRRVPYDEDLPYEPEVSSTTKKKNIVIATELSTACREEDKVDHQIVEEVVFKDDESRKMDGVSLGFKPLDDSEEINHLTKTTNSMSIPSTACPVVHKSPEEPKPSLIVEAEFVPAVNEAVDMKRLGENSLKMDVSCSKNLTVQNHSMSNKDFLTMQTNESSEIGVVEIEIGDEVPSIAATGSRVLKEPSRMNDCEIEMLILAGKAANSESSTASQPGVNSTVQKEEIVIPQQPAPTVDRTMELTISHDDNRMEAQVVPVTASENPIETQQVSTLVELPHKIKLPSPTPETVQALVSKPATPATTQVSLSKTITPAQILAPVSTTPMPRAARSKIFYSPTSGTLKVSLSKGPTPTIAQVSVSKTLTSRTAQAPDSKKLIPGAVQASDSKKPIQRTGLASISQTETPGTLQASVSQTKTPGTLQTSVCKISTLGTVQASFSKTPTPGTVQTSVSQTGTPRTLQTSVSQTGTPRTLQTSVSQTGTPRTLQASVSQTGTGTGIQASVCKISTPGTLQASLSKPPTPLTVEASVSETQIPTTVQASVSDNVRVMIPEPQVEEEKVETQKTHPPFLLFNNGPTLIAGRIYISAMEGQPISLWRYNGLSFDPFVPAIKEIIKDCTKENVAEDVKNTNVPSS